eukprot:881106_1
MATHVHQPNQQTKIILKNVLPSSDTSDLTIRLSKGDWLKKLERINKKIYKEWKVTQYSFSIKQNDIDITIQKDDANKLKEIISNLTSPVTIHIISNLCTSNNNDGDVKANEQYMLVFRYQNIDPFQFPIDKGFDPDDDNMFLVFTQLRIYVHVNPYQFM